MPIDKRELEEKGKPVKEPFWSRYQAFVNDYMEERFRQPFQKRKIMVGRLREFDAVSEDREILVQVKTTKKAPEKLSNQEEGEYLARYMLDAIKLERAPGRRKIFVIYPKEMKEWFLEESIGLLSPDIEVSTVPLERGDSS